MAKMYDLDELEKGTKGINWGGSQAKNDKKKKKAPKVEMVQTEKTKVDLGKPYHKMSDAEKKAYDKKYSKFKK